MKNEPKFFICKQCGNMITFIHESGAPVVCCGEKMDELTANTTEASNEKHLPVINVDGNKVTVEIGSAEHPMTPEHYIQWIYIQTDKGYQMKYLTPEDKPKATFVLSDEKLISAYEYCNLHGLWKTEYK